MSTLITPTYTSPVHPGKTIRVAKESPTSAGARAWTTNVETDAVLVSLFVSNLAGTFDLDIYTQTEEGKDLLVASFPTISAPTTNLLIKKAATVINQLKLVATYSGATTYEIYLRGTSSSESSVRVLGSSSAQVTQITIPTNTPTLVISSSLVDRAGLVLKNNNAIGVNPIYIGFTSAEASSSLGYPIAAQESLGMDISSGVELWVTSPSGTADIRIIEAGG